MITSNPSWRNLAIWMMFSAVVWPVLAALVSNVGVWLPLEWFCLPSVGAFVLAGICMGISHLFDN